MSNSVNSFGLSRTIPDPIKRRIRQRCGYGCVLCGNAIVDYEHVDPAFADATAHDETAITLLCPTCHAKVTRNFWSKEKVRQGMLDPYCKRVGFSNEWFDVGKSNPVVIFAGATLRHCRIPVEIKGTPLIMIEPPEDDMSPYRISANFHNSQGQPSLKVVQNEWQSLTSNWDVEAAGGAITIRDSSRHISLCLVAIPGEGIRVDRLDMLLHGWHIQGNADTLTVSAPGFENNEFHIGVIDNCEVGISLG
jgi:hypothetical protein